MVASLGHNPQAACFCSVSIVVSIRSKCFMERDARITSQTQAHDSIKLQIGAVGASKSNCGFCFIGRIYLGFGINEQ